MISAAFRVSGRVQGVGFRWWVRMQAGRLGLAGTVRNVTDGSVEVVAGGAAGAMEEFEGLLHRGPPGAHVEAVVRSEVSSPLPGTFTILS